MFDGLYHPFMVKLGVDSYSVLTYFNHIIALHNCPRFVADLNEQIWQFYLFFPSPNKIPTSFPFSKVPFSVPHLPPSSHHHISLRDPGAGGVHDLHVLLLEERHLVHRGTEGWQDHHLRANGWRNGAQNPWGEALNPSGFPVKWD